MPFPHTFPLSDQKKLATVPRAAWEFQIREDVWTRIRACRRVVFDEGSFHPSVYTVSSPIRDPRGFAIAAATILRNPGEFTSKNIRKLTQYLAKFVALIEGTISRASSASPSA